MEQSTDHPGIPKQTVSLMEYSAPQTLDKRLCDKWIMISGDLDRLKYNGVHFFALDR